MVRNMKKYKKSAYYCKKLFLSPWARFAVCITLALWVANASALAWAAAAGDADATAATQSENAPVRGGRLLLGSIGEPSNLIPALSTDSASFEVASLIYVAPLRYDKDLNIESWAAKSYEVLDGGLTLRFTLRDDVYWEDGVQLTAEDVAFTYRMMIDPKTPTAYAADWLAIKTFTVTGPFSFEVRYETLYARAVVTWMSSIMPRHLLEGQDLLTSPLARKPVGAGPFRLKSWESGSNVVLAASDSYFLGRPYLDEVVYRVIPDLATMFLELKARRLDSMGLTPQQYLRQTTGPWWEENWRKYRYLSFSYTYLGYNLNHPLFSDVRVRQALTHAIDRQSIIDGVLLGQGESTIGPFVPGTWVYNEALNAYAYDPHKARALLAEAGWKLNPQGRLEKDGQPFAFTILTNQGNDQRVKAAIIIQSQLKALGIDVRVRTVEWAAFIKEFVHKKRFDAILLAWTVPQLPDPYQVWHSSAARPGGLNATGYMNTEVDTLLEEGRSTLDDARRKQLYDRFQEILHEEQPYTFLYVPYALPVVDARFHGIEAAPAGIMYNLEAWWVPRRWQNNQGAP